MSWLSRFLGIDGLASAIRVHAKAQIKAARIAHPKIVYAPPAPPEPPSPLDVEFEVALLAKRFEDQRERHLRNCYKALQGKRSIPPGWTRATLRDQLVTEDLPLPIGA